MLIVVFHLPILVTAMSFLTENFKSNLTPQLCSWAFRAETSHQDCRHFAHFSVSNHWESNPVWNFLSLFRISILKTVLICTVDSWALHQDRGHSLQGGWVGEGWYCNSELWCMLSANLGVLGQRAWNPVAGSYLGSCLDRLRPAVQYCAMSMLMGNNPYIL